MANTRRVIGGVVAPLALGVLLAACTGSPPSAPTSTPASAAAAVPSSADLQVPQSGTSTVPGAGSPRPGPAESKVLVIVDENHTQAQAQADMPFLVSMQDAFGVATNYTSQAHPSLPNYLTIAGGSTFGVTNDAGPGSHPVTGPSVFGAALTQGRSARTYNEAMTGNCELASHGDYAVKHNPWAYFADESAACQTDDVPLTTLPGDIVAGALPTVGMITPGMCHDGHNCPLKVADEFLRTWVPALMDGPDYRSGHLTIVITFDEGEETEQTIETVVINPAVRSVVVSQPLTHAGLSRWLYRVSGSAPQNDAVTATDVGTAFGL